MNIFFVVANRFTIDLQSVQIETMELTGKKGKKSEAADRRAFLEKTIAHHRNHEQKLEIILRLLDNEAVDIDAVDNIRENVEYYVESNQEPDFLDDETIYDELELDLLLLDVSGC
jgi:CCR4-NOT transcription complex subunit 3